MIDIDEVTLATLTDKQREALDLLILHKSSKEISRMLGISRHTVDQRFTGSKKKLGVASRSDLAQAYRRLLTIYEQSTYEESGMAKPAVPLERGDRLGAELFLITGSAEEEKASSPKSGGQNVQILPNLFEGRWRILVRLGFIALIGFLFTATVLVGIAIFEVLSGLLARP